jgi:threonine synthase
MRYVSTRGRAPVLDFEDALLTGLASDGGLYVPETWPQMSRDDIAALAGLDYARIAARVMAPYVAGWIDEDELSEMTAAAYAAFGHDAVVPLVQYANNDWLLELFHGPTCAFKDVAMQMLGRLFDRALERRGERVTIVGATSGDTGSAAIAGCAGRERMDIFILFPKGRVSDVQRRQMTTVDAANVRTIAIDGTFDDCQALVKAMFNDDQFRRAHNLAAVNSINWARVMAQIVYYIVSAVRLGAPGREVAFCVPSANFGAMFAGYCARRMGLPIARLIVATNANDILARFIESGDYRKSEVIPTLSPSMDIQVSSNFERALFEFHGRDARRIEALMADLKSAGGFSVEAAVARLARETFDGHRLDDTGISQEIARILRHTGVLIDPHTACGTAAARATGVAPEVPVVVHAQAHPAKFPEAVEAATGRLPDMPERLAQVMNRPERVEDLPNDLATVQAFIKETSSNGVT